MNGKTALTLLVCVLAICGSIAMINYLLDVDRQIAEFRQQGNELKELVARIPLGISPPEVADFLGEAPRKSGTTTGVLVNASTMLAETNPASANHGPASTYTFQQWIRGHTVGVVVYDSNDVVAGHWSFPALASQHSE